tara:strand:- start:44 stop:532 length:489 start_codon:yes stop_codon:yes gene_type:complete
MFKTRLLISLLISFIFYSCTKNISNQNIDKYSLGYVSGEYDGLVLKNLLKSNLSGIGVYDDGSNFRIEPKISHSSELFITNIDNTSDRIRVDSTLIIDVVDQRLECITYKFEERVSQFYLFADSDRYISNNIAEKKIREQSTETLVKGFINKLNKFKNICDR